MEGQRNNKGVIVLLVVIIIMLSVLCILFATDTIVFNKNQMNNSNNLITEEKAETNNIVENDEQKDNITFVGFDQNGKCENGCTKNVKIDGVNSMLFVDAQNLKIGNNEILSLEGAEYIKQVTIYDDIILLFQSISLGCKMIIYDLEGNIIKEITEFVDENNKLFNIYLWYDTNNSLAFNVSNDGKIEIVGTKHLQGVANTYMLDNGIEIDLCSTNNISDDEIVKGIFEFSYLGGKQFSDIKYNSTTTTVKEIKSCN